MIFILAFFSWVRHSIEVILISGAITAAIVGWRLHHEGR